MWQLLCGVAFAQDGGVDIERYRPPADHFGYVVTESADTLGNLQLGAALRLSGAHNPLVLVDGDGELVEAGGLRGPVQSRLSGELQLGMGFSPIASLSVALPVLVSQQGYLLTSIPELGTITPIGRSGLGDVRLTPKIAPLSLAKLPVGLALSVPITLPTGAEDLWFGEAGLTVSPTLIAEVGDGEVQTRSYTWRAAVNVGASFRPDARVYDVPVGTALIYRAAAAFRPIPALELVADLHGQSFGGQANQSPLELDLGVNGLIGRSLVVQLAGGLGVVPGVGTPDARVVGGLSFAPSFDPNARDADKDGVSDGADRCVKEAEDPDGFQDEDGCPDPDNDADVIDDLDDDCPDDAEDLDGYRDDDGCPDADNDQDGIPDASDRCPDEAELRNGYQDSDGCPDANPDQDSDGDGFGDEVDRCPYDAEDVDAFQDLDGCPDADNDGDGLTDAVDRCPNAKETFDGVEDDDGCPETVRVKLKRDRIEITEKVFFDTGKTTIQAESFGLLDEVARTLQENPELKLVRIEGHTDNQGSDAANLELSQGRAEAVREYLILRGVAPERLVAVGLGETQPIASNSAESGRATNRRVEFIVLKRE